MLSAKDNKIANLSLLFAELLKRLKNTSYSKFDKALQENEDELILAYVKKDMNKLEKLNNDMPLLYKQLHKDAVQESDDMALLLIESQEGV